MRPKSALYYVHSLQDVCRDFVEYIKRERDDNKIKGNFLEDMHMFGMEAITLVALDTRMGCFEHSRGEGYLNNTTFIKSNESNGSIIYI